MKKMPTITPKYSSWSWSTSMTFKSRTTSTNKTNWPPRKCQELRKWYLKAKQKSTRKNMAFWVRYFGGSPVKTLKFWSRCNRFFFLRATSWLGAWLMGGFHPISRSKTQRSICCPGYLYALGQGTCPKPQLFCSWVPLILVLVDDATSKF